MFATTTSSVAGADYYAQHLVVVDADGVEQTASYEDRGYIGGLGANGPVVFNAVKQSQVVLEYGYSRCYCSCQIQFSNLGAGGLPTRASLRATYHNCCRGRDTNSLHLPDAYLCLWHYNLGRPMTWFSDSRTNKGDAAVDKKPTITRRNIMR